MSPKTLIAAGAVVTALALPSIAPADKPAGTPGNGHSQSTQTTPSNPSTPGPGASNKAKGKAYGKYCAGQSKKHVKGQKGTPFSQCVTAMAKLANGDASSPKSACKGLSKKHVKGQKGTPYSRCIVAAAQLNKDQQSGDDETTTAPSDTTTTAPAPAPTDSQSAPAPTSTT